MFRQATVREPVHVSVSYPAPATPPATRPADGLSPWSARVLEQLSLTAWLPAAFLVANVYLVAGMYLVRDSAADPTMQNLSVAVSALDDKPVGIIIAVICGVVLSTLVTQSFEFAAIRFLEGYWGGSILTAMPTRLGIRQQQLRRSLTRRRADKLTRRAFRETQARIGRELQATPELASAVLLLGMGAPIDHVDPELRTAAQSYYHGRKWMIWAPPHLRHRTGTLAVRLEAYPARGSRLMPTRLGNTLRAAEEKLKGNAAGAQMRGYLYRHLHSIEPALMHQHTQYRNRLDMFSVMTVLSALLIPANAMALPGLLPMPATLVAIASLLTLSLFSYRGAVSAAVDYGAILVAIDAGIANTARKSAN